MSEKKRILIVEDEAVTALDITDILESLGHEVVGHEVEGQRAIDAALELNPDLVLMDIKIKGPMDGITAAGHIWETRQIPIIFLTAFADEETLSRAKLVQPYGYILKPFEEDDLRTTLEIAFHRSGAAPRRPHTPAKTDDSLAFGTDGLDPHQFLRRVDPFRKLPEAPLENIASFCGFTTFDAGSTIMHEGDEESKSFIVASGRIALTKSSSNGKELTVDVLPPGDVYAVLLAQEGELCAYTARAQIKSTVLQVPTTSLSITLQEFPWMYKEFSELLTERVKRSHDFSRQLAHEKVEVRIAWMLSSLLTDFARLNREEESYRIEMTRQQLADLTGTTPETAIRVTKKLEREGILELDTPGFITVLDSESLTNLTENI